ncbi:transposase [Burkholderia lata]|uniref:Transposase n=1 Tax=Burkholderia lata (strain ATCC 17760 / DSM 23089 / LMG 22485 / NCIMB 9086 / R18194 / 383) TaxID=482957 RepID=A0A6P2YXR6_BURL3|nr:transposase [Burkholderia lata]
MGYEIPTDCRTPVLGLGSGDSVLRLRSWHPKIANTTNAIESLHTQLRKITKARGHFPSDEAPFKLIYWPCATSLPS